MARPIKNNADYFSHDNDMRDDERIKAVRRKFSHLGYSTWNMLLERLCRAENFKAEYNEDSIDIMAGDFSIEPEQLKEIIDYLIKLKLIIQEGEIIFSQTMINRFEGLFRKRKRDAERLSLTITKDENIIADDNAQSKVKDSKGNKRKENEIKEKGNKVNQPPIFFNNFSFSENNQNTNELNTTQGNEIAPKEKSSAKKENFIEAALPLCKQLFEKFAPMYVWENKDHEQLAMLLQKICITKPDLKIESELAEAFYSFIQKLPEYWRTKKFTIPNLNFNYNEIVSEIRANNQSTKGKKQTATYKPILPKQPEIQREKTPEEKIKIRKDFIKSICEAYEKFVATGEHGYLPMWVMHDTLIEEKVLKLTEKKLEQYRTQAIEARKAELSKPKHPSESRTFRAILENFSEEMEKGNEKNRIDIAVKNLVVQGLFNELKKKQTDIKTLFKK
jgi:hypothetical protein